MIIMSFHKTIVLAFVASSLSFGVIQVTGYNLTVDKYLGRWYTVGATISIRPTGDIWCDRIDIIRQNYEDWTFSEVSRTVIKGQPHKTEGYGKIVNSEITTKFPSQGDGEDVYTTTSYNNGDEIILHDKFDTKYHVLMSRKTTASAEAREALEKHARDINYYTIYMRHGDNCTYINN